MAALPVSVLRKTRNGVSLPCVQAVVPEKGRPSTTASSTAASSVTAAAPDLPIPLRLLPPLRLALIARVDVHGLAAQESDQSHADLGGQFRGKRRRRRHRGQQGNSGDERLLGQLERGPPAHDEHRFRAGNRPPFKAQPSTLSTALCRPTSSRAQSRFPAPSNEVLPHAAHRCARRWAARRAVHQAARRATRPSPAAGRRRPRTCYAAAPPRCRLPRTVRRRTW